MSRQKRKEKLQAHEYWGLLYKNYYNYLEDIVLSRFKWENVEPEIDQRFIEWCILNYGYGLYFKDKYADMYAFSRCTLASPLDRYDNSVLRKVWSCGFERDSAYTPSNSVIIYDNLSRKNLMPDRIRLYSMRLANAVFAIDNNLDMQKATLAIVTNNDNKLSNNIVGDQFLGGVRKITVDETYKFDSIKVIETKVDFKGNDIQNLQNKILNEFLSSVGVDNNSQDKRERQTESEVVGGLGLIERTRNSFLEARQQGCDSVNKMFGLNMSVEYNTELSFNLEQDMNLDVDNLVQNGGVEE